MTDFKYYNKMNNFFKTVLQRMINFTTGQRINVVKTLVANFALLPFKQAIHLPILIHGSCKLGTIKGKVILNGKISRGMVNIGSSDFVRSYGSKTYIAIMGVLELEEGVIIRKGMKLRISPSAKITLKKNSFIGDNCSFVSDCSITIGENTRIEQGSFLMDTDYHYIVNLSDRTIKDNLAPIVIGDNNWFGMYTIVKKRTITPNGTIVLGPFSSIGKDYTKTIPEYSMIGGSPAKLVREGYRRIYNLKSEEYLLNYFKNHESDYRLDDSTDIDAFCAPAIHQKQL